MVTPRQQGRVQVLVTCGTFVRELTVPVGQTVGWCVNASGLSGQKPGLQGNALGVWGKIVPADTVVAGGDRIEVYEPCDPVAIQKARKRKADIAKPGISGDKSDH